jgi:hypothetical protein
VSTIEELLERKIKCSGLENREYVAVGIVCSRTKATKDVLVCYNDSLLSSWDLILNFM